MRDAMFRSQMLLFVAANVGDLAITLNLLAHDALGEANPAADLVLSRWGAPGFVALKAITVGNAVVVLWLGRASSPRLVARALTAVTAASTLVVGWGLLATAAYYLP